MPDMTRFEGRVVVITGGARGIGKVCAERFAQEGARVAVLDIDESAAKATAEEIDGMALQCDVSTLDSVQAAFQAVIEAWGRVDVLCANAGVYRGGPLAEVSLADWQLLPDVNLTGAMLCCQAVAPTMMKQRDGSIVVMSSMAGKTSWPATAAYSASKTGIIGLMRSVAQELAPYNINCNAVCPGNVLTDMLLGVARISTEDEGMTPEEWVASRAQDNPMRRLAKVEEIASVVAFLTSDEARYVNGQAIEVDGGMVMS
jgi:NAD(P)-dependent dehydrogenase (short-subunit alcohol dehydrogenase family)